MLLPGETDDVTYYEYMGKDHYLGKKQLPLTNKLVSCQVEGRQVQYLQSGNLWRNIGENREGLHNMVFIYLEKAHNKVPREYVWRCIREMGVSDK